MNTLVHWLQKPRLIHILLVAAILRMGFCLVYIQTAKQSTYAPLNSEQREMAGVDGYILIAETLLEHGKYALDADSEPVSFRAPLQPLLMMLTAAWSPMYWAYLWTVMSVLLSTFALYMAARTVHLFTDGNWVAVNLCALAGAIYPYLILSTKAPYANVTLAFLFSTLCYLLVAALKEGISWMWALGFGTVLGLGLLLHGIFQPLTLLGFVLVSALAPCVFTGRVFKLGVCGAFIAVLISPWLIRNQRAFGEPLPFVTGAGLQYWIADACYVGGAVTVEDAFEAVEKRFESTHGRRIGIRQGGAPRADDMIMLQDAKADLKAHPYKILLRIKNGFWRFWAPTDSGARKAFLAGISNLPLLIVFLLAVWKLLPFSGRNRPLLGLILPIFGFYSVFVLLQAISAYFVVIVPSMLALCAVAFERHVRPDVPPE